jgi:hypothetical protein
MLVWLVVVNSPLGTVLIVTWGIPDSKSCGQFSKLLALGDSLMLTFGHVHVQLPCM